MFTRHNALRNARLERYENMYFAQQIELRDQREEKRKEEERKKKAEEEELRLEQLKKGERFEHKLSSSDTLVGLKLTDTSDTSEIYLTLINQFNRLILNNWYKNQQEDCLLFGLKQILQWLQAALMP